MPHWFACLRPLALLLAVALVPACTRQPIAPMELRVLRVDWSAVDAQILDQRGVQVQGVVFTPAQWPLEASAKRLFQGDYVGIWDAFDISFSSSSIPDGVLRDLYDEGYLPAYLRIRNPADRPLAFFPELMLLEHDVASAWRAVAANDLPEEIRTWDSQLAVELLLITLLVVAEVKEGRGPTTIGNVGVGVVREVGTQAAGRETAEAVVPDRPRIPYNRVANEYPTGKADSHAEGGKFLDLVLTATMLQPGEAREGLVFFRVTDAPNDWRTTRLRTF